MTIKKLKFVQIWLRNICSWLATHFNSAQKNLQFQIWNIQVFKMAYTEIDSFVAKFKNLWHCGQKATLKVDSENGEAVVTLTAGLGHIPPPFSFNRNNEQTCRPYRGASYQRRQRRWEWWWSFLISIRNQNYQLYLCMNG